MPPTSIPSSPVPRVRKISRPFPGPAGSPPASKWGSNVSLPDGVKRWYLFHNRPANALSARPGEVLQILSIDEDRRISQYGSSNRFLAGRSIHTTQDRNILVRGRI